MADYNRETLAGPRSLSEPLFPSPIRLDRETDLGGVRARVCDWPGRRGPLVCLPDLGANGRSFDTLGHALAPGWRVLALDTRERPAYRRGYQVDVADTTAFLVQWGLERAVLVGCGFGALVALVTAAWHSRRLSGLILIDGDVPRSEGPDAEAYLDGPPDLERLQSRVRCAVLVVRAASADPVAIGDGVPGARVVEISRPGDGSPLLEQAVPTIREFLLNF